MPITAETLVTAGELALVLGLSKRHVDRMAAEGLLPLTGKARFKLAEAVAAYMDSRLTGDPEAAARLIAARADKERALASLRQQEVRIQEGRLLDADEVRATWSHSFLVLRDRIRAVAHQAAPLVLGLQTVQEVAATLGEALDNALRGLADGEIVAANRARRAAGK